jgi:hypothetical protein
MNAEITANSPSRLYPKIVRLPVRYSMYQITELRAGYVLQLLWYN